MTITNVWVLIAHYSDNSGKPEVIAVLDDQEDAEFMRNSILLAEPSKNILLVTAPKVDA